MSELLLMGDDFVGWQVSATLKLMEYDILCTCHDRQELPLRERMARNSTAVLSHDAVLAYLGPGIVPMETALALATARLAMTPVYLVDKWGGQGVEFLRAIATRQFDSIDEAVNHIIKCGV